MGCRNRAVGGLTAALASLALVTTGCGTAKAGEEGAGPPGDPLRVLLAGDSITAGYYASGEDRSYAALLEDEWDDTAPVDAQSIGQPGARAWLASHGYDAKFGARPIRRLIETEISHRLSSEILFGKLAKGGTVRIDAGTEGLEFHY